MCFCVCGSVRTRVLNNIREIAGKVCGCVSVYVRVQP